MSVTTIRSRELPQLDIGDHVRTGAKPAGKTNPETRPKYRDKIEIVVETCHGNRPYTIKMDGSGRTKQRNRRFMRKILPMFAVFQ